MKHRGAKHTGIKQIALRPMGGGGSGYEVAKSRQDRHADGLTKRNSDTLCRAKEVRAGSISEKAKTLKGKKVVSLLPVGCRVQL